MFNKVFPVLKKEDRNKKCRNIETQRRDGLKD